MAADDHELGLEALLRLVQLCAGVPGQAQSVHLCVRRLPFGTNKGKDAVGRE